MTPDELVEALEREQLADRLEREREEAERRAQIAELRRLLTAENHRQDVLRVLRDHAPLCDVPPLEPLAAPGDKPRHTWVLLLSDWQTGQATALGDTGHTFEQSTEIVREQIRLLWERLDHLLRIASRSIHVDELWLLDLGDLQDGDSLRVSQAAMVDSLATRQCIDVFDLEAWFIRQAMRRVKRVRVRKVGGNHDRTSSKPGNAGLGELGFTDTYAWLCGAFLERYFERAISSGRLELVNHESFFGTAVIAGQRVVYEHGASFRASTGSYGGVSFYSIANAARGYQQMLGGADLVCMGHFHNPMLLPMQSGWGWQVVNGALPPSSQYAQSSFKAFGRPCQVLLDLHSEHGLVGWRPLYLDTEHQLRPGEFWDRVSA